MKQRDCVGSRLRKWSEGHKREREGFRRTFRPLSMWVACCHLMSRLPNHVHITSQPRFILCGLFGFFLLDQVTKLLSVYRKYCYRKATTEIFTSKPCPPKNWLILVIDILIGLVIQVDSTTRFQTPNYSDRYCTSLAIVWLCTHFFRLTFLRLISSHLTNVPLTPCFGLRLRQNNN